jgi:hypothetical protein
MPSFFSGVFTLRQRPRLVNRNDQKLKISSHPVNLFYYTQGQKVLEPYEDEDASGMEETVAGFMQYVSSRVGLTPHNVVQKG